jgi:hypothetical protein
MKVYLNYNEERCGFNMGMLCSEVNEDKWSSCTYEPDDYSSKCKRCYLEEHIICKEAKNIEIVKDINQGFVKIGRTTWGVDEINLLKVDYGNGWVVEIGEE